MPSRSLFVLFHFAFASSLLLYSVNLFVSLSGFFAGFPDYWSMACVAVSDADDEALEERGYHLAKYLSCCGASQCAETHVCSRRWGGRRGCGGMITLGKLLHSSF